MRPLILSSLGLLILASCGDAQQMNVLTGNSQERIADNSEELAANSLQLGKRKFKVTVKGGYGSGDYTPGERVYIWSQATTSQVVQPWSGESKLLQEPKEWATSFIMPSRNVSLSSSFENAGFQLKSETFAASSSSLKRSVYYHFPQNMRAVAVVSHGTGGNSEFIKKPEMFAVAAALVKKGYGIIATEAEEVVSGDLNLDGKIRWRLDLSARNPDLAHINALFESFQSRKLLSASVPKVALGMSAGGAMSVFLSTVSASRVALNFPHLKFKAVASYCADAKSVMHDESMTPVAWYMCGQEDHPEVSNTDALANYSLYLARGIPTEFAAHPITPVYDARFSRVPEVTVAQSVAIVRELRAAGFIDSKNNMTANSETIYASALRPENAKKFTTLLSLSAEAQRGVRSQVDVMRAEHQMYSDYAQKNIDFFERFIAAKR